MSKYFFNEKFSDFKVISSDNVEFNLHRNVLAFNEYFHALLTSRMTEAKEKIVRLPERSKVLCEIFRFIYCGKISALHTCDNLELIVAANKYSVFELEDKCRQKIMGELCIENAVATLIFASTFSDILSLELIYAFIGMYVVFYDTYLQF